MRNVEITLEETTTATTKKTGLNEIEMKWRGKDTNQIGKKNSSYIIEMLSMYRSVILFLMIILL